MKLTLICCSPSSGSTFLADVIDSIPGVLCGPETNLFSNREFFEKFPECQSHLQQHFSSPDWTTKRHSLFLRRTLAAYGWTQEQVLQDYRDAKDPADWIERLFRQITLPGASDAVWVEETPRNIFSATAVRAWIPGCRLIHLVRHPVYVYASLRQSRGLAPATAMVVLMNNYLQGFNLPQDECCHRLRYEDLVAQPESTVDGICRFLGLPPCGDRIHDLLRNNTFRRDFKRHAAGWSVKDFGTFRNANNPARIEAVAAELRFLRDARLQPSLLRFYGLPDMSLREITGALGYDWPVDETGPVAPPRSEHFRHHVRLFWANYRRGDCPLSALRTYLFPFRSRGPRPLPRAAR